MQRNIQDIRDGGGTWFVEFPTYRWREHCGYQFDNNIGYRTELEFIKWKKMINKEIRE